MLLLLLLLLAVLVPAHVGTAVSVCTPILLDPTMG